MKCSNLDTGIPVFLIHPCKWTQKTHVSLIRYHALSTCIHVWIFHSTESQSWRCTARCEQQRTLFAKIKIRGKKPPSHHVYWWRKKRKHCVVTHRHAVVWCHTGTQLCKLTNLYGLETKKRTKEQGSKNTHSCLLVPSAHLTVSQRDVLK